MLQIVLLMWIASLGEQRKVWWSLSCKLGRCPPLQYEIVVQHFPSAICQLKKLTSTYYILLSLILKSFNYVTVNVTLESKIPASSLLHMLFVDFGFMCNFEYFWWPLVVPCGFLFLFFFKFCSLIKFSCAYVCVNDASVIVNIDVFLVLQVWFWFCFFGYIYNQSFKKNSHRFHISCHILEDVSWSWCICCWWACLAFETVREGYWSNYCSFF